MCYRIQASLQSPGMPLHSMTATFDPQSNKSHLPQPNGSKATRCFCIISTRNNVPLIPCLCHMCVFPDLPGMCAICQDCIRIDIGFMNYSFSHKLLSFNFHCCLELPSCSRVEPLLRMMTLWCDIGHISNCMHSPSLLMLFCAPLFTLFYPGIRPALALKHNVLNRGSFAFQSSLLYPIHLISIAHLKTTEFNKVLYINNCIKA